jgi:hypothetical protein
VITKRKAHVPGGPVGHPVGVPCNQGTANGQSKLTPDDVWAIRAEREAGDPYRAIAERHGVTYTAVWKICNGQAWWHLQPPPAPVLEPPRVPYWHHQLMPAQVWTVVHHLGFLPAVLVIDSARRLVYPDVEHLDVTALVVRFSVPLSGEVQCR